MNDKTKAIVYPSFWVIMYTAAIIVLTLLVQNTWNKPEIIEEPLRGVNIANEYHSTTTESMTAVTIKAAETFQLIKTGQSTIGSIIVASTTGHTLEIINATSTRANALAVGTSIIKLATSTPVGSYIFDVAMSAGLVVKMELGFGGLYNITYR